MVLEVKVIYKELLDVCMEGSECFDLTPKACEDELCFLRDETEDVG